MSRRTFSRTFKLDLVHRVAAGAVRPTHLCRDYGISPSTLSQWCTEYALRGDAAFTPKAPTSVDVLERRVAELERRCQQHTLENTLLKNALPDAPTRSGMRC